MITYLNFDIENEIEPMDWLTFPEQTLYSITAGAVYHDDIGLQAFRDRLAYYPNDIWLYQLAAVWRRIAQEEHLMGRAGSVGDEIGSAIIASRLVRDIMRLGFLMEKKYAPYSKWLGTAFCRLDCGKQMMPILRSIQLAEKWSDREQYFAAAWEYIGAIHNNLGITSPLQITFSAFHTRTYRTCNADEFEQTIRSQIKDPAVSRLAGRALFGGIDQISDNTDFRDNPYWRYALKKIYQLGSMENPPDCGGIDSLK